GVKFIGRLGNQLFQVAFLHYLKTSNPDKTFFFVNPHHSYINKYFELGKFYDLALGSKFYSIFTRSLYVFMKSNEEYIQSIHVPIKVNVKNWVVYKGFYQTDWYYNHTPSPLNLKIKPKFINNFENKFGELF